MIIYEVSTKEHDNYGYCQYYIDHKFYLHLESAHKDWRERLDDGEDAECHIRHIEDEENEGVSNL
jgi:hypothetical protein